MTQAYITEQRSNKSTEYIFKVELLDKDENILTEITSDIVDGEVNINLGVGSRRNARISINNQNGIYTLNSDNTTNPNAIWLDNKFLISTGIKVNGENNFFAQGVYVTGEYNEPTDVNSTRIVEYELYDKFTYLDGTLSGQIINAFNIPNGTNVSQAIRIVLEQAQNDGIQISFDVKPLQTIPTTLTVPYTLYVDQGRTYFDILSELCQIANYTIYFDAFGYPNFVPVSDPEEEPSRISLEADDIIVNSMNKRVSASDIKNRIRATGNSWDNGVIYDFTATQITGSVGTGRIGTRARLVENDTLASEQNATDLANFELALSTRIGESLSISTIPMDNFDVSQVITVTKPEINLSNARFQIGRITLPLFKNSTGTFDLQRTVELG